MKHYQFIIIKYNASSNLSIENIFSFFSLNLCSTIRDTMLYYPPYN